MKKENLEDYELFYLELPKSDYLEDIEIQDEYEITSYDEIQGLSDQQVSAIAKDSLDAVGRQGPPIQEDNLKLFSERPQESN
jgi:hypothetical protein